MGDFANSLVFVSMVAGALFFCWKYWPTPEYIVTKLDNYYDYVISKSVTIFLYVT